MADQTQRLEIATVRAEVGSNIVFRFANDAANADSIPTQSGDIQNLKQVVLEIQQEAAEKISISTTIYPTVAAGLAATTDQAIFLVQSDDANEIYTVWKNEAGSAVNTGKTAMSSQAIQTALEASNDAAQAAEDAADTATARTAGFLAPSATAPVVRDNGLPLQGGDRYFNTEDQTEYLYKQTGWVANDSLEAIAQLEARIVEAPADGATPKAGPDGKIAEGWMPNEIARSTEVQSVAEAVTKLKNSTIRGSDYNIDTTGATSAVAGLNAAWADFRETVNEGWRMATTALVLEPGVYLIDDTVDFTGAFGWNLDLEAPGVVFLCRTAGKVSVEMLGTRGLTCRGLSLYGDPTSRPLAGILLGPSNTDVCGNNEFVSLKTNGHWERAAVWNIGSETTLWQHCYFINYFNGADSWSYLGDAFNAWGVTGVFRTVRATMVWASLTCNDFKSCRFAHHGGKSPLYLDGVFHWTFDLGCYFLTWGTACITIRCRNNSYRNVNLDINGLFESGGASMYGGLDDCIRIVCENGVSTGIEGFRFNSGQPQSKRALIRIETPDGSAMTTGVVKLTGAQILGSRTINAGSDAKLFSGARLMVNGKIDIRDSNLVNLNGLQGFQGELFTENYDLVQKPSGSLPFSFVVHDEVTNSGRAITFGGVGADVDIISGSTPQIKVSGTATDVSLDLNAKGSNGRLKLNSGAVAALPFELPSYTLATLPPAASWVRCLIIVSDATGGPAHCRSNGTNWTDLRTRATVV